MSCLIRWSSGTTTVTPRSSTRRPRACVAAVGDLDDGALGLAPVVEAAALGEHASPCMTFCISRGGRNRSGPPASGTRSEAVAMADDPSGDQVEPAREHQHALAVRQQLPSRSIATMRCSRASKWRAGTASAAAELGRRERSIGGAQRVEDLLAGAGSRPCHDGGDRSV
jgi:hypothetical protein